VVGSNPISIYGFTGWHSKSPKTKTVSWLLLLFVIFGLFKYVLFCCFLCSVFDIFVLFLNFFVFWVFLKFFCTPRCHMAFGYILIL